METQKRCFLRLCALLVIGGRMGNDCEPAQKWEKTANRPLTEPLYCVKLVTIKCVDGDK